MENFFVEFISFIVELTKLILCMKVFLKYQFRNNAKYLLSIMSVLSYLLIISSTKDTNSFNILTLAIVFSSVIIISGTVFKGKLIKVTTISAITYVAISTIDTMFQIIFTKFPLISTDAFNNSRFLQLLSDSVILYIIIIIIFLQKKFKRSIFIPLKKIHWSYYILLSWILVCFILLIAYTQYIEINSGTKESILLTICLTGSTIGVLGIVIMISKVAYSRDNYRELSRMNQEYLDIQQQYYILLSEKNEDIRRFQHDIKNHFLCIQALAEEDKVHELKKYIHNLSDGFSEIIYKITIGNNIVDAILSDIMFKRPDLNIVVDGRLSNPIHISAMDLCTIFSNVLTNAAEAAAKLEDDSKKIIKIDIKNLENKIYIKAINPVIGKVLIEENSVVTTKSDRKQHGFGLGNIQKCVDKYHGSLAFSSTESEFVLEIIIRNENMNRSQSEYDRLQ